MDNNRFGLLFEADDASEFKENIVKKKVKPNVSTTAAAPQNNQQKSSASKKTTTETKITASTTTTTASINEKKSNQSTKKNVAAGQKTVERKEQPRGGHRSEISDGQRNDRSNTNDGTKQQNRYQRNRSDGRSGKREFDRQSGSDKTGVKAVEKRNGAGAHNWGSVKQDIDLKNIEALQDKTDENKTNTSSDEQNDGSAVAAVVVKPIEEEPNVLTLDEWKAQQEGKRAKPQFNIRKAGEGEDTTKWNKMIVLKSNKTTIQTGSDEELEYDPSLYPQRVGRLQRIVDIQFNFNDNRRGNGRGFRGKKGAGNNDRKEGVPNNGAPKNNNMRPPRRDFNKKQTHAAPKVDDVRQFPTLA